MILPGKNGIILFDGSIVPASKGNLSNKESYNK
jgi:hypothetical protein